MQDIQRDSADERRQVKSKERVAAHGEVFTAEREVNAMLDLVKEEAQSISARFLEPACGDGNFVCAILRRKLNQAREKHSATKQEYEERALECVCSVYGIEIQKDNVNECRDRVFRLFADEYASLWGNTEEESDYLRSVRFVIEKNIVWGDTLAMCEPGASADSRKKNYRPIVFSEWKNTGEGNIERRQYALKAMIESEAIKDGGGLFDGASDDTVRQAEYAKMQRAHYLKLYTLA